VVQMIYLFLSLNLQSDNIYYLVRNGNANDRTGHRDSLSFSCHSIFDHIFHGLFDPPRTKVIAPQVDVLHTRFLPTERIWHEKDKATRDLYTVSGRRE
jgi:hypothetical protein